MAETKAVSCAAGVYTALSTAGQTNVSFKTQRYKGGRVVVATSLPSPSTADFYPLDQYEKLPLGSLGASDVVYYMPESSTLAETIYVFRGA